MARKEGWNRALLEYLVQNAPAEAYHGGGKYGVGEYMYSGGLRAAAKEILSNPSIMTPMEIYVDTIADSVSEVDAGVPLGNRDWGRMVETQEAYLTAISAPTAGIHREFWSIWKSRYPQKLAYSGVGDISSTPLDLTDEQLAYTDFDQIVSNIQGAFQALTKKVEQHASVTQPQYKDALVGRGIQDYHDCLTRLSEARHARIALNSGLADSKARAKHIELVTQVGAIPRGELGMHYDEAFYLLERLGDIGYNERALLIGGIILQAIIDLIPRIFQAMVLKSPYKQTGIAY